MPIDLCPATPNGETSIGPLNVGKSTLLAALSLPHGTGNGRNRHRKAFRGWMRLDVRMPGEGVDVFRVWFRRQNPIRLVWAAVGEGLETVHAATYHLLRVIRVDTKVPGGPTDRPRPITLPNGRIVLDLAGGILRGVDHFLRYGWKWAAAFSMVKASSAITV